MDLSTTATIARDVQISNFIRSAIVVRQWPLESYNRVLNSVVFVRGLLPGVVVIGAVAMETLSTLVLMSVIK